MDDAPLVPMSLAEAYAALAKIETRERHVRLAVDLANGAANRSEKRRYLRIAASLQQSARDIEWAALSALAQHA
jgi:hypothetical protein